MSYNTILFSGQKPLGGGTADVKPVELPSKETGTGIIAGNHCFSRQGTCQNPCVCACTQRRLRVLHPQIAQRYYQGVLQYVENQRKTCERFALSALYLRPETAELYGI